MGVNIKTKLDYLVKFPHTYIDPDHDITIYNQNGIQILKIPTKDNRMNYEEGYFFSDDKGIKMVGEVHGKVAGGLTNGEYLGVERIKERVKTIKKRIGQKEEGFDPATDNVLIMEVPHKLTEDKFSSVVAKAFIFDMYDLAKGVENTRKTIKKTIIVGAPVEQEVAQKYMNELILADTPTVRLAFKKLSDIDFDFDKYHDITQIRGVYINPFGGQLVVNIDGDVQQISYDSIVGIYTFGLANLKVSRMMPLGKGNLKIYYLFKIATGQTISFIEKNADIYVSKLSNYTLTPDAASAPILNKFSTATYYVDYPDKISIVKRKNDDDKTITKLQMHDKGNGSNLADFVFEENRDLFKIPQKLLGKKKLAKQFEHHITATYNYQGFQAPLANIERIFDGSANTQSTWVFSKYKPNLPMELITIDLKKLRKINAIDVLPGFYRHSDGRRYDVDFKLSFKYSTAHNFISNGEIDIGSGSSITTFVMPSNEFQQSKHTGRNLSSKAAFWDLDDEVMLKDSNGALYTDSAESPFKFSFGSTQKVARQHFGEIPTSTSDLNVYYMASMWVSGTSDTNALKASVYGINAAGHSVKMDCDLSSVLSGEGSWHKDGGFYNLSSDGSHLGSILKGDIKRVACVFNPKKADYLNGSHTQFHISGQNMDISGIQFESPNVDGLEDIFSGTNDLDAFIQVSPADLYAYTPIDKDLTSVDISSTNPIKWDVSNYDEAKNIRYFKVVAEEIGEVPFGHGKYIIAIKDIKLYEDALYRGEAKLVASGSDNVNIGTTLIEDKSNLLNNIGDVVYKDTDINENLDTKTKTEKRAYNILRELYKQHTNKTIEIIHNPEINIGDTVQITSSGTLPGSEQYVRNYLVEGYNVTGGRTATLSLSYYP